jgi:hypothetical protein
LGAFAGTTAEVPIVSADFSDHFIRIAGIPVRRSEINIIA